MPGATCPVSSARDWWGQMSRSANTCSSQRIRTMLRPATRTGKVLPSSSSSKEQTSVAAARSACNGLRGGEARCCGGALPAEEIARVVAEDLPMPGGGEHALDGDRIVEGEVRVVGREADKVLGALERLEQAA